MQVWCILLFFLSHTPNTVGRSGLRCHFVFTEHTPAIWTKAIRWQMRFASGGGEHACISERVHARVQYMCMCLCACAFTCVSEGGVGRVLRGQLCVCPICHPTLLTPKGTAERVENSFWQKGIGVQWPYGQQCRFYWWQDAKDTGWACGSQSTNLFDKTVGYSCQDPPQPA